MGTPARPGLIASFLTALACLYASDLGASPMRPRAAVSLPPESAAGEASPAPAEDLSARARRFARTVMGMDESQAELFALERTSGTDAELSRFVRAYEAASGGALRFRPELAEAVAREVMAHPNWHLQLLNGLADYAILGSPHLSPLEAWGAIRALLPRNAAEVELFKDAYELASDERMGIPGVWERWDFALHVMELGRGYLESVRRDPASAASR